ncbi:MAG: MBL fold metallo-hydrolase [Bacillota bacterium]|nr:MBL fold metallo-hydrolase [Bacillota bacterium]
MILECLPNGLFESNSYVLGNKNEGIILDAGVRSEDILEVVNKHNLTIKYIILTHAHIDHICEFEKLRDATKAEVILHEADVDALSNPFLNGSLLIGAQDSFSMPDRTVKDGDVLILGEIKLEIIHTPGHTPGCICVKVGDIVFTGDTLFKLSVGRTDLANGNPEQIIPSIKSRLMVLPDETIIYPGHYDSTTIGYERKYNSFIKNA